MRGKSTDGSPLIDEVDLTTCPLGRHISRYSRLVPLHCMRRRLRIPLVADNCCSGILCRCAGRKFFFNPSPSPGLR